MDKTLFQLRLFVHQRLYAAAEEILGHFEKTIMLAVPEVEGIQSLKGAECLRHQLSQTNTGCPLTSSTTEQTDEADTLVLLENQDSCSTEQSNFSLDPEVPGPSQPCADLDNDDWNLAETDFVIPEIKEEQKDLVDENQTPTTVVAALSDSNGEELVNNAGGDVSRKDEAELPDARHSVKGQQERHFCHLCGKSFLYIGALMRHTAKHESKTDCGLCGLKHPSTKRLVAHLKSFHSTSNFCEVCGRTYAKKHSLRVHKKVHTGNKDFVCQECGKSFYCKAHLVVHVRTHSGDKPYKCDICGKAFSQSQSLLTHKRGHLGEKPYHCEFCGKGFVTSSALNNHLRFHTGEKPYSCNICGKTFRASGQMTRHRATHTGEGP